MTTAETRAEVLTEIRGSLIDLRNAPPGGSAHFRGVHYGIAHGKIWMACTAGFITYEQAKRLGALALNASHHQELQEANHA